MTVNTTGGVIVYSISVQMSWLFRCKQADWQTEDTSKDLAGP